MGRTGTTIPSRFLADIPSHLVSSGGLWAGEESQIAEAIYAWDKIQSPAVTTPELKAGDHVRHPQFGDGVVVSCQQVKDDREAVVVFSGWGLKKLLLSLARLEKIE
jgi:DNA helicase-2/ATP-dependent DNA helicase PcrA